MAMNEVAEYPIFKMEVLWARYNSTTYYTLTKYMQCKNTAWSKLKYTFHSLDYDLATKVAMKTQDCLISRNADKLYYEYHLEVHDALGRSTETTIPVIIGEQSPYPATHSVILNSTTIGSEFMYSDMLAQDDIYSGFSFTDCKVLSPYEYIDGRTTIPYYTDGILELKEDRLKIIGEVVEQATYALVDNVHKRAMPLFFTNQSV